MRSNVEIKLQGQRIPLKASDAEPEITRLVLDLVTEKIQSAEGRSKSAPPHQVALLALLELAEEHVRAKRNAEHHLRLMTEKSERLISLVEAELQASERK